MSRAFGEQEETTRAGVPKLVPRAVPPLSADLHEAMGQLMAETVAQGRRLDELARVVGENTAAISGFENVLLSAIAKQNREREGLVQTASTKAATHTSNRLAALLGALVLLYSEAAPVLHELWRQLHH
ncbi:MAG TPA: hypothetical protein VNU28_00955 [Solirubrobacteraceae bacterium]|jgi:hypothetical protein|nr:hypothetical protein [Solirubrobacteraceae bacterium]